MIIRWLVSLAAVAPAQERPWVAGASSLLDATIRTACRLAGNPATP